MRYLDVAVQGADVVEPRSADTREGGLVMTLLETESFFRERVVFEHKPKRKHGARSPALPVFVFLAPSVVRVECGAEAAVHLQAVAHGTDGSPHAHAATRTLPRASDMRPCGDSSARGDSIAREGAEGLPSGTMPCVRRR